MRTNGSHFSGNASSGKIASTGHSGSQAPQSMHSSGSITSKRAATWMQSTGQTSMHDWSLMSMHGSAITYVIDASLYRRQKASDHLLRTLEQRRLHHHLVEACGVPAAQPFGVLVVREAEQRDVGVRVGHIVRVDPADVRDHEIGRVDSFSRDE